MTVGQKCFPCWIVIPHLEWRNVIIAIFADKTNIPANNLPFDFPSDDNLKIFYKYIHKYKKEEIIPLNMLNMIGF